MSPSINAKFSSGTSVLSAIRSIFSIEASVKLGCIKSSSCRLAAASRSTSRSAIKPGKPVRKIVSLNCMPSARSYHCGVLEFEDDLSKTLVRFEVFVGRSDILKAKYPINNSYNGFAFQQRHYLTFK